jgi:type II secretory pathway component GspD/PulD (secretin)
VDILSAQTVTTLSGRRAQLQTAEMKTIANGIKWPLPPELATGDGASTNTALAPSYLTESLPLGPCLDITPVVSRDGTAIELDITAKVTEFIGYDEPGRGLSQPKVQLPLPHFRVRSMQTQVKVLDGQTLLLANPKSTELFPGSSYTTAKTHGPKAKSLLVFVTTTLIDSTGKPIHPELSKN